MTEKQTYTGVLASVETHIIYINNHLENIDTHLEKLNNKEADQNIAITKNKNNIGWVVKIGTGIVFIVLTLIGIAAGLVRIF